MDFTAPLTALRATVRGYYNVLSAKLTTMQESIQRHYRDTENPHQVTKKQIGLSNVENYTVATRQQAIDGRSNTTYMTPRRTQEVVGGTLDELADVFNAAADELE